jgi:outer membrane protein
MLCTNRVVALCCGVAAAVGSSLAQAEERPLWELGLGVGGLTLPDYRGANERHQYVFPVPYVVYRGEVFKADREGARAQLTMSDRIHVDINVGASVPVSSKQNKARAGMPNLDGSIEVGPALDVLAYRADDDSVKLRFRVPVSYGLTLGSHFGGNGWQAAPHVNLDLRKLPGLDGWNLGLLTGPIYGSRARHAYFYDVAPQYATADRATYRASGGYAGTQFIGALSKRYDGMWVGGFVRYDSLNGAAFADSPLVKSRSYVAGGVGVAWVLGQSSERVKVD